MAPLLRGGRHGILRPDAARPSFLTPIGAIAEAVPTLQRPEASPRLLPAMVLSEAIMAAISGLA